MSYLSLVKKIMNGELSDKELVQELDTPNIMVIQHVLLKIGERNIKSNYVCSKLVDYSTCIDSKVKILGTTNIGHLAIYTLKILNYISEYEAIFNNLSDEDKEKIYMLEKAL